VEDRQAENVPVLAIDGPSGSGKGTVAQRMAEGRNWHLLDSGALYRVLAQWAGTKGVALDDGAALAELASGLPVTFEPVTGGAPRVILNGHDVSIAIRTEQAGNRASQVAALPAVRAALLERQRRFRAAPGLVADGRDMGTVVFPDAVLKVFLTASAQERARRRYKQLMEKGIDANIHDLAQEIAERDRRDATREAAPLRPANDAFVLDTSELSVDGVVRQVEAWLSDKLG
jgi:cytidylate kinase